MKARDLLLGVGIVASVCAHSSPSLLRVNSTPTRHAVSVPAGTLRPLYGAAVKVAAFNIDRDPVTRDEYIGWKTPGARVVNPRAPMTEVTWAEAREFCLARGQRLPTLAEWEYVAAVEPKRFTDVLAAYMTRSPNAPVEAGTVNRHGVRGLHNLVWEWVGDPNTRIVAMHQHGAHDLSCAGAAMGATDQRDYPAFLRSAFRSGLTESTRLPTLGFRCAS
jgi:formylglycine-generating enzyme required for sulfatase activity